jgi:hypothetical protein
MGILCGTGQHSSYGRSTNGDLLRTSFVVRNRPDKQPRCERFCR